MENLEADGQFYDVRPPLDEVVSHFYHLHTAAGSNTVLKHLSPNFDMLMIFNFGAPIRFSFNDELLSNILIKRTSVIGPLRKMLNYELQPGTDAIIVNFTLNGFYRLFKIPMSSLSLNELTDPDILIDKKCFAELWEQLAVLNDIQLRFRLIEEYAASFISVNEPSAIPLLSGAAYFQNPVIHPVKAIAENEALSERTIQQRFQKFTGYSPKEILRFIRFKKVIYQIINQEDKAIDLFELIETHGYHDQSHLIKDFNHFLGTTPRKFIKNIAGKYFCMTRPGKHY
ncbi:AraC-like DNA-binding protein [Pedobacter cryoconitis]|uniref:AraC family transcriptional regulator n=1 Tax=Pedobacter cryoconitis TaxID=188932 RepID=UPI00160FE2FF|nr:helix-turn-helix domain-containing protein [Pedobacter cryoconitis]MBB6272253.1 AraC-like DNA-binding protein [Pedobacter cryoconitis]